MALVMLPSDLPWWDSVKKQLNKIANTKNSLELVECMQKIYEMCNISLDPEDDNVDPEHFVSFLNFLDNEISLEERSNFFKKTLPNLVKRALMIKELRPKSGLHFSLQQQADMSELPYTLVSSLLANAFFSTFPKRTDKSHPTLQNFNFSTFLKDLSSNAQKSKLRSFFYYFEWLENNLDGCLRIFRQIMSSKEWLTIDDWLECSLPLCPVQIRHDGKLERSESENLQVCFSSSKLGGSVLENGVSQESLLFSTTPELLVVLLSVESLEDNEVITVENVRNISRISDPKHKASLEKLTTPRELTVCCMDADDYTKLPIGQYEEDNVLRELNKCLLGFQQKHTSKNDSFSNTDSIVNNCVSNSNKTNSVTASYNHRQKRLSPIGESFNSVNSDKNCREVPLITQDTCSSRQDSIISQLTENNNDTHKLKVQLEAEKNLQRRGQISNEALVHNRRGRFIVLGSSGECLPVTRSPFKKRESTKSDSSSCESEEFLSAKSSLEGDEDEKDYHKRYSIDLQDPASRQLFAHRLKQALKENSMETDDYSDDLYSSEEDSYAIGISVAGSGVADCDIKVRRQGSTGFALGEDSLDEEMFQSSLDHERQWVDKFRHKQSALCKRDSSNRSSDCSFSTDYSSELEEVYEQFSQWLENPILETEKGTKKNLNSRDMAVVRFAGSLLKRTLSESFAGVPVPMAEPCETPSEKHSTSLSSRKNKLVLNAKSLSLELARQKHRLAAQLSVERTLPPPADHCIHEKNAFDEATSNHELTQTKRAWYITCMQGAIIQTLEDIVVKICHKSKVSQIAQKPSNGLRPITTGNWGCGASRKGDAQLKVVIQWMAASVAGAPSLFYYTNQHQQLAKLDTVCRILIDRKWTVKDLAEATLRYSNHVLRGKQLSGTLFEELIGVDKNDNL